MIRKWYEPFYMNQILDMPCHTKKTKCEQLSITLGISARILITCRVPWNHLSVKLIDMNQIKIRWQSHGSSSVKKRFRGKGVYWPDGEFYAISRFQGYLNIIGKQKHQNKKSPNESQMREKIINTKLKKLWIFCITFSFTKWSIYIVHKNLIRQKSALMR